jgi:hypothetical protein
MTDSPILPLHSQEDRPPVDAWYDDQKEMEERLRTKGLDGLREIAQARREAGYGRGDRMTEWCLLGTFFMDTVGNFSPITEGAPVDVCAVQGQAAPDPVLPASKMREVTTDWVVTFRPCLPPAGAVCERCGEGWDFDNVRDFFSGRDVMRHESCQQQHVVERETEEIRAILEKAEVPFDQMEAIPNGYDATVPNYYGPWFLVHTDHGKIKIGWRKRVINIDWKQTTFTTPSSFKDEAVTQGPHYIPRMGSRQSSFLPPSSLGDAKSLSRTPGSLLIRNEEHVHAKSNGGARGLLHPARSRPVHGTHRRGDRRVRHERTTPQRLSTRHRDAQGVGPQVFGKGISGVDDHQHSQPRGSRGIRRGCLGSPARGRRLGIGSGSP